jgi:3',5'-cyclic-AMP phosphodiesterase
MEFGMNRLKTDNNQAQSVDDGIGCPNFLARIAWAGTGLLWTMATGVPTQQFTILQVIKTNGVRHESV